jgi:phosphoglycerate kinase
MNQIIISADSAAPTHMKPVTQIENLVGKYVILRSSLNLPVVDGVVTNEYRLKKALPTMRYLSEAGAKVIVIGHIGRDANETLKPVFEVLKNYLPAQWGGAISSDDCAQRRSLMQNGDILLLENTRQDARYKNNDSNYDEELALMGELFVFDAFAVAHREQASVTGITSHLPSYAGLTMLQEIQKLSAVMKPASPSLFIIGGAKFDTKMPLVEKYLDVYNHTFIGGALINDVLKAKGFAVGKSLVSDVSLEGAAFLDNPKLLMPVDLVVDGGARGKQTCAIDQVQEDEAILDIGPKTVAMLRDYIAKAATILWNGPFGNYEGGYVEATEAVAKLIAESGATSVVGGGDTVAAIEKLGINDQFTHVSTGGGAMLQFLENGTLPVIDALT